METLNLFTELTPVHFLMAGLGLQMLVMTAMWFAAEAAPARSFATMTDLRRHIATAEIVRPDFPGSRSVRNAGPAVASGRARIASAVMERNAA